MRARRFTNHAMPTRSIRGFTLIEVLIALIIMSVGMLGIAGLYVHSMQAGRTSLFHHHAVMIAGDVADRIRANPSAGVDYQNAAPSPAPVPNCVVDDVNCTPQEMAATDIFLWSEQAAASLPNGDVDVVFNGGVTPNTYAITVSWTEPGQNLDYTIQIPVFGL